MCGICGYQGNFQPGLINRMMGLITHRGPDDQGFLEDPNNQVALGHRRLSIIDLSSEARQPLKNEKGSIHLICNGEIYNYKELRQELIGKGHRFKSRTDSEVLIHLYEEEGTGMLLRLNGIFAFAMYIRDKNEIFCARDQLGVKPFYYAEEKNSFIFASELKAILSVPQVSRDIDPVAIHNHLTFLWSPSPVTMFKSIRKLEAGFALLVKNNRIKRHWRYYDIPYGQENLITSQDEAVHLVQESLKMAVSRQLVSDVPIGAFLSGGLDSSSVVAMMKALAPDTRPKCFTISFAGGKAYEGFVNDLPYARKVARHLDVDLEEIVIEANIANNIEKVIYFLDEPQADLAPINIKLICQGARDHGIKVLLSGAGGDDIFSGYSRHKALYLEHYWSWLPRPLRHLLSAGARSLPVRVPALRRIRKLFENAALTQQQRDIAYFFWLSQNRIRSLYSDDTRQALCEYDSFMPMNEHLAAIPNEKNRLNRMLYLETKTFLPDHNLNYTDKMSMSHGVEVRVPLLDIDLINTCARISPNLKQKGMIGKYILKKSMEPFLPKDVIYRPKGAIPGPLRDWLLNDLKPMVHDMLSEDRIKRRGWFDYRAVCELIRDNESMKIDASYSIWALVSLEMWANIFLDRAPVFCPEGIIKNG